MKGSNKTTPTSTRAVCAAVVGTQSTSRCLGAGLKGKSTHWGTRRSWMSCDWTSTRQKSHSGQERQSEGQIPGLPGSQELAMGGLDAGTFPLAYGGTLCPYGVQTDRPG